MDTASGSISFTDPALQKCPFSAYLKLRQEGPVYKDPKSGFYVVLDHSLARKIAEDVATFSSQTGVLLVKEENKEILGRIWREEGVIPVPAMVVSDPPAHTFHRSLVEKAFTPGRVRQMEEYLGSTMDEMIDQFIDRGEVRFLSEMAVKAPMHIFADQLGVPRSEWQTFVRWANAVIAQGNQGNSLDEQIRITHTICELQHYTLERAAEYRQQPANCILSDLANACDGNGRRLSDEELATIVSQLIVAGFETTAATMTAAVLRIVRTPGLEDQLRNDRSLIPGFIEEVLRIDAPIQGLWRRATVDTELAGIPVPAGSILQLQWGAANRDPAAFAEPDAFDPRRANARRHMTFGFGPHTCVANQLARGELRVAVNRLLDRLRNFRLLEEPEYFSHSFAYGVTEAHVAFDKIG